MAFEDKIITGDRYLARLVCGGEHAFELEIDGSVRLAFGRVTLGGFSEVNALPSKMRLHESLDGLSGSFEGEGVIPFGCEYLVKRQMNILSAGIGTMTVDLSAVNHGVVGNVELEDVLLPGTWEKLEFLVFGEEDFRTVTGEAVSGELYHGSEPVIMLRGTSSDGIRVEYACGSDIWRHRAAKRTPGGTGEFILSADGSGVTLKRAIIRFAEDAIIEKRPWRFKSLFSWSTAKPGELPATQEIAALNAGANAQCVSCGRTGGKGVCLCSSPARKLFKDLVRKTSDDIVLDGGVSGICFNAAHQDRPGKGELEHWDLGDWVDFYLWANRQLLRQEKHFRMKAEKDSLLADSVTVENFMR